MNNIAGYCRNWLHLPASCQGTALLDRGKDVTVTKHCILSLSCVIVRTVLGRMAVKSANSASHMLPIACWWREQH